MRRPKHIPLRRCIVCGAQREKPALVRVVRSPAGEILVDVPAKEPGRGAYICRSAACLTEAARRKRLDKPLRVPVPSAALARLCDLAAQLGPPDVN